MNTSVRFDSTTIRHIRLKYRYLTQPLVEYWATIRPQIMAEYFSNSKAESSYSPKFVTYLLVPLLNKKILN